MKEDLTTDRKREKTSGVITCSPRLFVFFLLLIPETSSPTTAVLHLEISSDFSCLILNILLALCFHSSLNILPSANDLSPLVLLPYSSAVPNCQVFILENCWTGQNILGHDYKRKRGELAKG